MHIDAGVHGNRIVEVVRDHQDISIGVEQFNDAVQRLCRAVKVDPDTGTRYGCKAVDVRIIC